MLDVSDKCKKLSDHLHRSELSRKLLTKECESVGHYPKSIPQANDTRWDSRHTNMEWVTYHKECLVRLARQGKLIVKDRDGVPQNLIPTLQEFNMINAGVTVLQKCKVTSFQYCNYIFNWR